MRTNIVLDDRLMDEAARLSGIRTKKDLVHAALEVFIATKKRKSLLDLEGKIEFAPGYDYKASRSKGTSPSPRLPKRAEASEVAEDTGD